MYRKYRAACLGGEIGFGDLFYPASPGKPDLLNLAIQDNLDYSYETALREATQNMHRHAQTRTIKDIGMPYMGPARGRLSEDQFLAALQPLKRCRPVHCTVHSHS